jgi:hypothetical protein
MKFPVYVFLSLCFFPPFVSAEDEYSRIFWIDQTYHKIQSAYLNGWHVTDIATGVDAAEGIAIDTTVTPMKIHYAEAGKSRIMRMNFDGSDPEEVVTDISGLEDLDLDLINRKVFWLKNTYSDDRIMSADMDSLNSNVTDVYKSSYANHDFRGIGVDALNQTIYWSQSAYSNYDRISRIGYDGRNREILISINYTRDIDVMGNLLYWIRSGSDLLIRSDKACSHMDTILHHVKGHFFAMDTSLGMAFWTESKIDIGYSKIMRANLDDTGAKEIITGIGSKLAGIALYYNPEFNTAIEAEEVIPHTFSLMQNYPNPFNPETTIRYRMPVSGHVDLSIYNGAGQKVATLVSKQQHPGVYQVKWNAPGLPSGIYFYKIRAGNLYSQTRKCILLK